MRPVALTTLLLAALAAPLLAQSGKDRRGDNPYLREVPDSTEASASKVEAQQHTIEEENDAPREDHFRPRFYAGFNLGAAALSIRPHGGLSYAPSHTVPTASFGVGAQVSPEFSVGLETMGWINFTGNQTVETTGLLLLGGRLTPAPSSGLYLRAGGGVGAYQLQWEDSWWNDLFDDGYCDCDVPLAFDVGLAWNVGAGILVPVGAHTTIGPAVDLYFLDVGGPGGYRQRVLTLGLTVQYSGHD